MRFTLRQIKLLVTDPLCYQIRLEKQLKAISLKINKEQSEYAREKLFKELETILCNDISSLLSEEKLSEALECSGIKHLVKSLVTEVSRQRFNAGEDSYVRRLRRAHQIVHFVQ